ncbi:hypothetical protein LWI28_021056 [Acer negundo]|uniref:Uncharacterized protein n=1 Tax=Acer negundo TaxID=4023 RepID=A0AAD5JRT5_ACENE|nr:hypothetical protein LWI28_021056 [Acer negundo]
MSDDATYTKFQSQGGVANCGSSVQECVEIEENDDQFESLIFENLTQQMVEAIGLEVVDKAHIEPTNLVVEEIGKIIENIVFEDFLLMSHVLVGQFLDYYSGFMNLWSEYKELIYANVPSERLSALQQVQEISQRDRFIMKMRCDFEPVCANLMARNPCPSLDICFGELLREEQWCTTQNVIE